MQLRGRIFNADGSPSTGEFSAGNWAIDGTDGFDWDNLTVTQLTGGNIVVGYVRSWAEPGRDESVASILNPDGILIVGGIELQQNDVTATESPPAITALDDGRFMAVWVRNGASDDTATMTIHGRIFNASGTPSSDEFQIGSRAVDGSDFFDTDNLVIERLSEGRVVIGFVDSFAGTGSNHPMFSIVDTTVAGSSAWQVIVADQRINDLSTPASNITSPPIIEALGDGGRFVAVWVDGSTAANNALKYRIYEADGTAVTPEIYLTQGGNSGVSPNDDFDWNNVDVVYNPVNDSFRVSWVGISDGNGTGIFTSGPIAAGAMPIAVDVVDGTDGHDVIGPGYIDAQGDQIDGTDGPNDVVMAGAGNDTISSGTGADILYGGAGDDLFILADLGGVPASVTTNELQYYNTSPIILNTDIAGYQSPPKMVQLTDGRVLYVWANNALADDSASMILQGRIFKADGLPDTGQFSLSTLWPIDGADGYDWDNLDLDALPYGRVLISYVRNTVATGGDEPVFSILDINFAPGTAQFIAVQNVEVQQHDTTIYESPPIATVLDNGNILFVWSKNGVSDNTTSMTVQGRVFDANGVPATNEFQIGNWAVDGADGYDLPNLTVTQLVGGNVVVGYVRNTSETGTDEPVFSVVSQSGTPIASDIEMQQNDTTTHESPPAITALDDGRFMAVWIKNGLLDDTPTMTIHGRIFNADGTASTNEFQVGVKPVDGTDSYDTDNLNITTLGDGRVVVGFVQSWSVESRDWPHFSIVDPSFQPDAFGFVVNFDVRINDFSSNAIIGPPIIAALGSSGNFVAVWVDGNAASNELYYRIFDSFGAPISQQTLVTDAGRSGVSSIDGFDWNNVQVLVTGENEFKIGWVTSDDGNLTGVATSGTINVATSVAALHDQIIGGETDESLGDTVDVTAISGGVIITYSGDESGRITDTAQPSQFAAFSEIENFLLGSGNDSVDGSASASSINIDAGAGNDTVQGGAGEDVLYGGAGADTLIGGAGNDLIALGPDGAADVIVLADGSGSDTITGLDGPIDNGDGTFTGIDTVDVSGLTGADGFPVNVADVTVGNDGNGNAVLTFPNGESVTLHGVDPAVASNPAWLEALGVPAVAPVDGTAGDDVITPTSGAGGTPYTDVHGDQIDGTDGVNDTVYGGAGNDSIDAGAGDDLVYGGADHDTVLGSAGSDTLYGDSGNDILSGGDDADRLFGGAGDDSIAGGSGDDAIFGGAGNDTVDGGDGDDFINTRTTVGNGVPDIGLLHPTDPALSYPSDPNPDDDRDLVYGGAGHDTILTGDDRDTIYGGAGNDSIDAGFDDDLVDGGDGNDNIAGGEGRDTVYGGDGDDTISGGLATTDPQFIDSQVYELVDAGGFDPDPSNNIDLLYGGAGNDLIYGFDDADTLYGGTGDDTLDGGIDDDLIFGDEGNDLLIGAQGDDTLQGGAGSDTLDGGLGDDLIYIGAGDLAMGGAGDDTFRIDPSHTGTAAITVVGGETGEDGAGDVLDLTGGRTVQVVYDQADPSWNGTTSKSGTATYLNAADEIVTINFSEIEQVVVCFARGTMIDTAEGEKPIETLCVGDLVRTADHDYQPIRWIGSKTVTAEGALAPILIKAGALGNSRDLRVSPQHRMLLGGWEAELLFGESEVLMAAKHLVNDSTILRAPGGEVEYFHMLFDTHEIVFANGAPSESFHPGQEGWGALADEACAEILHLFPQLSDHCFSNYGPSARHTLKAYEAQLWAAINDR